MEDICYNNFFSKAKFISCFVFKAFLISILFCLLIVLFAATCYYVDLMINVKSGNYKSPLFNSYVIVSKSMMPTINVDDAIFVKREKNNNYKVGDIISFASSDKNYQGLTVTHRIIGKDESSYSYTTKGDNNLVQDDLSVSADDIYGKVMFVIPKLGSVQRFLRKPINFIVYILIPVFFVFIYDGIKIFRVLRFRI